MVAEFPGGKKLLIDPGPYAVQGLAGIGLTPDDVALVFASHDHADHCGGIPGFIMTWLLGSSRFPESFTWAVPHDALAMEHYARAAYPLLFNGALPRRIETVNGGVEVDGTSAEWLRLEHAVENWGAVVRSPEGSFAYLPDSTVEGLRAHSKQLAGIPDVIMSVWGPSAKEEEADRFKFPTAQKVGELLAAWGSTRIFVQHLADPSDAEVVEAEIRQNFSGDVVFPEVGEWIDVN